MLNADVLAKAPYKIIEQKQFGELLNFVNAFLMFFSDKCWLDSKKHNALQMLYQSRPKTIF